MTGDTFSFGLPSRGALFEVLECFFCAELIDERFIRGGCWDRDPFAGVLWFNSVGVTRKECDNEKQHRGMFCVAHIGNSPLDILYQLATALGIYTKSISICCCVL